MKETLEANPPSFLPVVKPGKEVNSVEVCDKPLSPFQVYNTSRFNSLTTCTPVGSSHIVTADECSCLCPHSPSQRNLWRQLFVPSNYTSVPPTNEEHQWLSRPASDPGQAADSTVALKAKALSQEDFP